MSTPASTWRRPRPRPRWSGFPWPRSRSCAWRWAAGSSLHSGTAMSGHDELVVARAADRGRASGNRKHPARPVALNLWKRGRLLVLTGSGRGLTPETTNRLVCPSPATQRHPSITICGLLWVGTAPGGPVQCRFDVAGRSACAASAFCVLAPHGCCTARWCSSPGRCGVRVATRPVDRSQSLESDPAGGCARRCQGPDRGSRRPAGVLVAAREHLRCRRLGRGAGSIGAAGGFPRAGPPPRGPRPPATT